MNQLQQLLADAMRRIAQLERERPVGVGVSNQYGGVQVRPFQMGFPVELTSSWSTSTGYSWKQLGLDALSVTSPTVQRTGTNAVAIDGNTSLKSGARGWLEPDPSASGWLFISGKTSNGTTASGADSCAAILLADSNNCVQVTVVSAAGLCSGVDTTQDLEMVWDTDHFETGATDWVNADSSTGQVTYTPGTTPAATVDGASGRYLGCSGDGGALFAWKSDPPCDTGTATPCGDYLVLRFDCICCSIAGWGGADKWYCVDGVATFLTEDDRCNDALTIDSGPYDTEAEAEADCPPGITTTCCPDDPVPQTLNWTITSKTGLCSCAPTSGTVTYDAINGSWGSVDFSCLLGECEENAQYYLACVSGTWRYGTSNPPTGSDLAAASVTCNPLSIAFNKTALGDTYTITFTA